MKKLLFREKTSFIKKTGVQLGSTLTCSLVLLGVLLPRSLLPLPLGFLMPPPLLLLRLLPRLPCRLALVFIAARLGNVFDVSDADGEGILEASGSHRRNIFDVSRQWQALLTLNRGGPVGALFDTLHHQDPLERVLEGDLICQLLGFKEPHRAIVMAV